jgi:hypothetical protein
VSVAALRRQVADIRASLNLSIGRRLDTVTAADFVTGGRADFGRACSAKGDVVELVRSEPGEPYDAFLERARSRGIGLGAPRLVFGGLDPAFDPQTVLEAPEAPQRGSIILPDGYGLHPGQAKAARAILDHKRVVLRAGRRFGKSATLIALAADEAMRGRPIGYFSPLFKTAAPVFDNLAAMLAPLVVSKNRSVGELRLSTGGVIDIWSIETATIIARGRKYVTLCSTRSLSAKATLDSCGARRSLRPWLISMVQRSSQARLGAQIREIFSSRYAMTKRLVGSSFMRDPRTIRT